MKFQLTLTISTFFIFLLILSNCTATDNSLRTTLEKAWQNYLQASQSGKEADLEKVMTSYRFGTMKNNLISANRSFTPEMIKSIAEYAPDIYSAKFETLLENGPTAGLVYVKDTEEKDASDKPRIKFIFIKFVKEEGGWKVDGGMEMGSPKFEDDGKKAVFKTSDIPLTFEIDGKVLSAPKPLTVPEISAFLDIYAPGYKIQVDINGIAQETTINKSYSGLLKGGINKGINNIVIQVTKFDKDAPFNPTVTIRRILDDKKTKEVFKFEPKEDIEGNHKYSFSIDK